MSIMFRHTQSTKYWKVCLIQTKESNMSKDGHYNHLWKMKEIDTEM